jgi:copper homeostasis protein
VSALLEVIVTGVEEAREAEAGGADRLELLSSPEHAGLTPSLAIVEQVLQAVSIPVRVMLRPRPSMSIRNAAELEQLQQIAAQLSRLPLDGIVAGFIRQGAVDEPAMRQIVASAPETRFTFHRAFDKVHDQSRALEVLKRIAPVDRLLTPAGKGGWQTRVAAFSSLQAAAGPELKIIFAVGRDAYRIADLRSLGIDLEIHVGRAARHPQTLAGAVSRKRIAALKHALP